jgi:hypothetical protein
MNGGSVAAAVSKISSTVTATVPRTSAATAAAAGTGVLGRDGGSETATVSVIKPAAAAELAGISAAAAAAEAPCWTSAAAAHAPDPTAPTPRPPADFSLAAAAGDVPRGDAVKLAIKTWSRHHAYEEHYVSKSEEEKASLESKGQVAEASFLRRLAGSLGGSPPPSPLALSTAVVPGNPTPFMFDHDADLADVGQTLYYQIT